jgi:hypothetical protein
MSHVLIRTAGGTVTLPDPATIMIDRADGGQLVVHPSRRVWDRTALSRGELEAWNLLVAAAARGMLDAVPALDGGCLNYWDAGNWALHVAAEPPGAKRGPAHRVLHLHLCGRSPRSSDPSWAWGEAPRFPPYADRLTWSQGKHPFTAQECTAIVARTADVLRTVYGLADAQGLDSRACRRCGYPAPGADLVDGWCPTCRAAAQS